MVMYSITGRLWRGCNLTRKYERLCVSLKTMMESVAPDWHIGIVVSRAASSAILRHRIPTHVAWMPRQRGAYRAHPHIATCGGVTAVFYSEYTYARDTAVLACRTIQRGDNATVMFGDPLYIDGPHTSRTYPFVFVDRDDTAYMTPQEEACGALVIYRAMRFPDTWEPIVTVAEDFPALSPTLMRSGDHYYIAATDARTRELCIFIAKEISGPWTRMQQTFPALRCAGSPFVQNHVLYLPIREERTSYVTLYRATLTPQMIILHPQTSISLWRSSFRALQTVSVGTSFYAFDILTRACFNNVLARYGARLLHAARTRFVPTIYL